MTSSVSLQRPGTYSRPAESPKAPCLHPFPNGGFHPFNLFGRRLLPEVRRHGQAANRIVPNEQGDVWANTSLFHRFALGGNGALTPSVVIDHYGRHSLPHHIMCGFE